MLSIKMKKISNIDKLEAASIIEDQILFCLKIQLKNIDSHPIRVIQASKSLIGLNLAQPNTKLINFNYNYLEEFNNISTYKALNVDKSLNEVISIHDLESAFLNKDKSSVLDMLNQLKLVSSEVHILEYLIELSLKQTGKSFLIIWSIYKSILFLENKDCNNFINIATDTILLDNFEDYELSKSNFNINKFVSYNLSIDSLDLYSHLLEAYNSNLIRLSNIKPLIGGLIQRRFKNSNPIKFNFKNDILFPDFLIEGRYWLLNFIDNQEKYQINKDLIFFLDSIRCLFRFLDSKNYKLICFQFENMLGDINV